MEQHWPTVMRAGQPTIPDTHEQSNQYLVCILFIVVSFIRLILRSASCLEEEMLALARETGAKDVVWSLDRPL